MTKLRYLYLNDALVPYAEARVHDQSGAVKYGTADFEGLRGYCNAETGELYVFRLADHIDRLFLALRLLRSEPEFSRALVAKAIVETLRSNDVHEDVHIRVTAYTGSPLSRSTTTSISTS